MYVRDSAGIMTRISRSMPVRLRKCFWWSFFGRFALLSRDLDLRSSQTDQFLTWSLCEFNPLTWWMDSDSFTQLHMGCRGEGEAIHPGVCIFVFEILHIT
jgi:hypothetical protein